MKIYLLITLCLFFSGCSQETNPSKVAETFVRSICSGDMDTITKTLSVSINSIAPKSLHMSLTKGIQRCREKGGFKTFQPNDEKIDGEMALITGKTIYNDNSEEQLNLKLLKENGQWKIFVPNPADTNKQIMVNSQQ